MIAAIIILIVVCALLSCPSDNHQKNYQTPRNILRRERKRIQKARDKAEMDAFEDLIMYMEVFSDD